MALLTCNATGEHGWALSSSSVVASHDLLWWISWERLDWRGVGLVGKVLPEIGRGSRTGEPKKGTNSPSLSSRGVGDGMAGAENWLSYFKMSGSL